MEGKIEHRVRVRKLLRDYSGDKVNTYDKYSSSFWGVNKNEIDMEMHKKFIELIKIIQGKYQVSEAYGRTKTLTNYDFIIVDSLPVNHNLIKINVITQNPLQLLQFDESGNQRLLLEEEALKKLLESLDLSHFLTDKNFNLESSGYEVILNKPDEDWTKLKRNEIAIFRDGEHRYYALHGEKEPHLLPELNAELLKKLQLIGEERVFADNCRTKLSWRGDDKSLILHVLNEAKNNGHLYQRKSVLKALEDNEKTLYALHQAIVAKGGKPLFNNDKVSLVFHQSTIEQRQWNAMVKMQFPEGASYKKTTLIVTQPPALYQYSEDGTCHLLAEGEECKEAFLQAKLRLLEFTQDYKNLIRGMDLDGLSKLDSVILKYNGQSILQPADHPVVKLLMQFDSVEMVREQSDPTYLKSIVFTFPRSESGNILESLQLFKQDADELYELTQESKRNLVLC